MRRASTADIPLIRSIAAHTWPAAYGNILSEAQIAYMLKLFYSPAALKQQFENGHRFILETDKGFASYNALTKQTYKLQKLYVLPEIQSCGTGSKLIHQVETEAKNEGASTLLLNVNRENPAIKFYTNHGFKIVREEDIDIGNGFFMNDYIMEKTLD